MGEELDMETQSEIGSLWLTKPRDIAAHLACAVGEHRPVCLSGPGLSASGSFEPGPSEWPLFVPDPRRPTPLPRIGATVRAEYQTRSDSFSFFSRLVSVDSGGRWVLQPPLAVERSDRRAASRHVVVGVSGFCFRLAMVPGQPLLGLYDISNLGCAFVADRRRHTFGVDEHVVGQLHVPGEVPLSVEVEVRHSRDYPRQPSLRVYGCRFVTMPQDHEAMLNEFLVHWHRAGGVV